MALTVLQAIRNYFIGKPFVVGNLTLTPRDIRFPETDMGCIIVDVELELKGDLLTPEELFEAFRKVTSRMKFFDNERYCQVLLL